MKLKNFLLLLSSFGVSALLASHPASAWTPKEAPISTKWAKQVDPKNPYYFDRLGNPITYEALLKIAPADAEAMVTAEKMGERYDAAEAAMGAFVNDIFPEDAARRLRDAADLRFPS